MSRTLLLRAGEIGVLPPQAASSGSTIVTTARRLTP
jgi:hypothetical protein